MTDEKVLAFLEELCQEADKDLAVANRLAGGLRYYYINVHTTKAVSVKEFVNSTAMTEARRIYGIEEERELREAKETARDEKVEALEGKVDKLTEMFTQFIESQKPAEPAKKSGKKQAETEDEE